MAFQWRIRHKMMVGLGLVVGLMAVQLVGTLYGLAKFRATLKSIDSKQVELRQAEDFQTRVNDLKTAVEGNGGTLEQLARFAELRRQARQSLEDYAVRLEDTLSRGRDPNHGDRETPCVGFLRNWLDSLDRAVGGIRPQATAQPFASSQPPLREDPTIKSCLNWLVNGSGQLRDAITEGLDARSRDGKETFRTSVWIVCSSGLVCSILLCVLVRFFYGWIVHPLHDLEKGAFHVAQGDFEYRLDVHTGDELEDVARAFNNMTGRLREMYADLARQVNERSRQLVRSEQLAGVGFLAAGVAHEINNPLASIAFCSEALEGRLENILKRAPEDGDVVHKYLKMIQQEAFRCKAITQRLLEFSRGGERRREPTDLVELIQAVLDMVQHLQSCKGKQIIFEPACRLLAWVNAQEIKSVVLNLVVNALDSMDAGGTLHITLSEHDQMAEIVFADTGCGMSAEILENIFEPFFTRSRTGKGTGLGLSISHRVISQHGGEIEAASPGLNQGSVFTIRLPLQPAEPLKEEPFGHAAA